MSQGVVRQVVSAAGEIDVYSAPALRDRLLDKVRSGGGDVVVDMTAVTFLDSTGLGMLASVNRHLGDGRHLVISNPSGHVRRVLTLCGFDRICPIEEGFRVG